MENKEPSNAKKSKPEGEGGGQGATSNTHTNSNRSTANSAVSDAAVNGSGNAAASSGNAAASSGNAAASSGNAAASSGTRGSTTSGGSSHSASVSKSSSSRPGSAASSHSSTSSHVQSNRSPSHGQPSKHARNAGGSGGSVSAQGAAGGAPVAACVNANHGSARAHTRGHHGHHHQHYRERHRERPATEALEQQQQLSEQLWDAPAPTVGATSAATLDTPPSNAAVKNALSAEDVSSGPPSFSSSSSASSGGHSRSGSAGSNPGNLAAANEAQAHGSGAKLLAEEVPPPPQAGAPHIPQQPAQRVVEHADHAAPYNWQASKATLRERLAFMFNNEVMADVHFKVGKPPNVQRIPAHKFVLAIGSAVFDAMFNGAMATMTEEVELPDVEPAAFLSLLKFLYSDEVQIGPETVMTTLYTAKKYAVPALERACVEFLKRNLSSDNAFMLLTQARLFDEPQLAALCLETIDKNTTEALAADGFCDIDLDTLCVVLERDTLGIRESKLFTSVCRWAEAESVRQNIAVTPDNKRSMLGRALSIIRFPLMTVEEFAMGAAQSKILSDREVVDLFLHFTVNPKPSVTFLDTPRCCLTGKEQVVSRFCQIESRWGYSGTSDRIRFMVNRRIFVVGFGLYGSIHGPAEYVVNIQVIHTDSGKVCGQNDTSFQCDGSNSTFRVMFKEPVEILANTSFTACATLKGPDSYYGTKGLRKVTHESVASGKVTFQFTYAAGNNNGTSVEDGQLPEIIFYT